MAKIKDVRKAMAKAIEKELGKGFNVKPYATSDPATPFVQIIGPAIEPHQAFGGGAEWWEFSIEAGVANNIDQASQEKADEFIEDGKLQRALEADDTLGGLVDDLIVTKIEPRFWERPRSITGWEFTVRVFI